MSNANAALAAQMQSLMDELSTQTARIIAEQVQRAHTRTPHRTHVCAGGFRDGHTGRTEQTALPTPTGGGVAHPFGSV